MKCKFCKKDFINNTKRYKIYCNNKCNELSRKNKLSISINLNNIVLNKNKFIAYSKNKKIDNKQKFECKCNICSTIFETNIVFQRSREIPWVCRSCAITGAWLKPDYKLKHSNGCKRRYDDPLEREKSAKILCKMWKNDKFRKKVLKILHDPIIKKKALDNRKYKRINEFGCSFRSSYEYRFACALNLYNIKWKFEPMFFKIKSLNSIYFPDFYLPEYNLWIETKGYWYPKQKNKFNEFIKEYKNINIKIFYLKNIEKIEKGILNEITI